LPEDLLLVDTSSWYFLAYSKASQMGSYKARIYPRYVNRALRARAQVYRCGLSFSELAHVIEHNERDIWIRKNGNIQEKEYRNRQNERSAVVKEVESAWSVIKSISRQVDVTINDPLTEDALQRYKTHPLDGYDLYILSLMFQTGILQILTDDSDFAAIPGIKVLTCNNTVIEAAREQQRLVQRH